MKLKDIMNRDPADLQKKHGKKGIVEGIAEFYTNNYFKQRLKWKAPPKGRAWYLALARWRV